VHTAGFRSVHRPELEHAAVGAAQGRSSRSKKIGQNRLFGRRSDQWSREDVPSERAPEQRRRAGPEGEQQQPFLIPLRSG